MTDAELLDALQKLTETQFDEVQRLCVPANLRRHLASSRAPLAEKINLLTTLADQNPAVRGALVGHLALFEMTSTAPMSAYLQAARRLGELPSLARFYEVHVHADAEHGQLALDHVVAPFVAAEPDLEADVIFGAAALSRVESRFARALLGAWGSGRTSLWLPDHGGSTASLIAAVPA